MYLPQFHPIPENDRWWGKGFSEWTNVARARPLFNGHYQPHLPADLGFYDLRVPEVREAQAALAREYGIDGFCYYHYWFNGKRLLNRPVDDVLNSGRPDFPFMFCWANENWTRAWDGLDDQILIGQKYSKEDVIEHIRFLLPVFEDKRYIRINDKPVFAIYKSTLIPQIREMLEIWRSEAKKAGTELYLIRFDSFGEYGEEKLGVGFDAAARFEPFGKRMKGLLHHTRMNHIRNKISVWYIQYKFSGENNRKRMLADLSSKIDYQDYVNFCIDYPKENYKCYPCVTPMWDNTARKKDRAFMMVNSDPDAFYRWASFEMKNFTPYSEDENLFFINAWNEWAEGNHLEPCQKYGKAYLEAFDKAAKESMR